MNDPFVGDGRRLNGRTLLSFGSRVAAAGLSYVLIVVLARDMGAADYGWYAMGISLATGLGLAACGGQQYAILRFWPEYMARGEKGLALGALRTGARLSVLTGLLGAAIFAVVSVLLVRLGARANFPAMLATAMLIAVMAQAEYWSSALRSLGSVLGALLPRDVLWRLAIILVASLFTAEGWHLTGARALAWSTGVLLVFVVAQVFLARELVPHELRGLTPMTDTKRWKSIWLGMWGVNAISVILGQIDPVVVGAMLRSEQAGHFFAAVRTATLLTLPLVAANLVAAPQISSLYHRGDFAGIQNLCRSIAKATLVSTTIGLVVLLGFSHEVMGVFGSRFGDMDWGLRILSIGFAVNALCGPVGMFMLMTGRERVYFYLLLGTMVFTLSIEVAGIALFGMLGAAISNAVAQTIWNVGLCIYVYRTAGVDTSVAALFHRSGAGRAFAPATVASGAAPSRFIVSLYDGEGDVIWECYAVSHEDALAKARALHGRDAVVTGVEEATTRDTVDAPPAVPLRAV